MDNNLTTDELLIELEDAKKKIAEYEEKERINHISVIKRFGNKYSDEELAKEDTESLKDIADACERFAPSTEQPEILPVPKELPTYEEVQKRMEDDLVDYSSVFDYVAKSFDMTKLKIK